MKHIVETGLAEDRSATHNYKPLWTPHIPDPSKTSGEVSRRGIAPVAVLPAKGLRGTDRPDFEHASTPRNPSSPNRSLASDVYVMFGEECARRNIIPSFRLFEHWRRTDLIAQE
ncbi:MAG TPA: hypothetical protein VFH95_04020 [Candidatus Kapabacteria bacterium]|nr:hypothetical protein [Candidatus Kapabacteria bacterium]